MFDGSVTGSGLCPDDEHYLVSAAQSGDQEAFGELYRKYNLKICRYIKYLVRDDNIAGDLAQDTFLMAWESLPRLHNPSRFSSWLFRIAINLTNNYFKRMNKIQFLPLEVGHGHGKDLLIADGPESIVTNHELIKQALACVNPTYRNCFILYRMIGFPQKMIADIVQIKEAHVSVYVNRGMEQFREAYHRLSQISEEGKS